MESPIPLFVKDKTFRERWYEKFDSPETKFTWFNKSVQFGELLLDNLEALRLVFNENQTLKI